ncbi:MAG TPA: DJ-1/PfpI family protein [Chromatiaceae bacterium]|jgi:4-methyl-5(b-hydroxyethyl)-thiazole monophosphate biosynthesis|nr:DJ-1/PfpI family protein [Chromatiaceae bacterium]HIA08623.1 DJ-1/PfpI family protein [Chromatiaceae bacterium]HIB84801.1 DJ-1/PfpI family protein [Chromatiaceae bacterium]HIO14636.1 DJ-1/PfpI family protein [Chromatiales bacterium]HIO54732.1 DJ-1/PfpI family protein [Chromatiales bacterium]
MARVLVPLAQGCEELEAVTIIDLLRRAGIEVITASLDGDTITASRGVRLVADVGLDEVVDDDFDMVVLPGGLPGADHLNADARIHALLNRMADAGRYTAAICAAPKVLADAGLLDGHQATAYPGVLDGVAEPSFFLSSEAVVRDAAVITSRGPGTAMDFALTLIDVLEGADARQVVEDALVRPAPTA